MIEIVDHRPEWDADFGRLAARLLDALGPLALRVDHIGSTAVPGLAAKDVVDAQVAVASLSPEVAVALTAAGFVRGPADRDHVPPGAAAAEPAAWTKLFFREPPGERRANVHVRRAGAPNARYALLFRDYLVTRPTVAAAYAELKRRLAAGLRDGADYPDVKDPAVDLIYLAAEEWAAATGWRPPEPAAAARATRYSEPGN